MKAFYSVYNRTFTISVAHFNDADPYPLFWSYLDGKELPQDKWMLLLSSCHGHDFDVRIKISGYLTEDEPYLIADEELEEIVKEWHNKNLSVHPDFAGKRIRATTEYMAKFLVDKIKGRLSAEESVTVEVFEGKLISALSLSSDRE